MSSIGITLDLFGKLKQQGIKPGKDTLVSLLKDSGSRRAPEQAKLIHDLTVKIGHDLAVVIGSTLVHTYAKCGNLREAQNVFDRLTNRNVVTWGAIIAGHVQHGHGIPALELLEKMQEEGVRPNKCIFSCILKACGSIGAIRQGKLIHCKVVRHGHASDVVIGSALIDMYAKCGILEEARKVFDGLPHRNIVSWGAMIAGYAHHGHGLSSLELFERMEKEGVKPNMVIFSCILKACSSMVAIGQGRLIHHMIIRSGSERDVVIGSGLLDMYAKCGSLEESCEVFKLMQNQNAVSWNVMLAGFVQHSSCHQALGLFEKMQHEGIQPNKATFLCILEACGSREALNQGRLVHVQVVRTGLDTDVAVGSILIAMYANCSNLEDACKVFDGLPFRDVVSCCAMIAGYVDHGESVLALILFQKMQEENLMPDKFVFSCILKACGSIRTVGQGKLVHNCIMKNGLESDLVIGNTLVYMYAKCGCLKEAQKVFDELLNRNMVSWGTIIIGHVEHGQSLRAFELFRRMLEEGCKPDQVTFLCILKACSGVGALGQGKWIHEQIVRHGYESDVDVGNSLIDMYAKCRDLEEACKVFDGLPCRDSVSWGSMMAACVQNGDGISAIELFATMHQENVRPNRVMLLCILMACRGIGAFGQGKLIHEQIIKRGLESDVIVGNTVLDMYVKCGDLVEARKVFDGLPNRDLVSWGVMIAGYADHGFCRLAMLCLDDMKGQGLKPHGAIYTTILSACSTAGLLEEGRLCFTSMTEDHGIMPSMDHLVCMADLFGRAGYLEEAEQLLQSMPVLPSLIGWTSLLTACRKFSNMELGRYCFSQVLHLDPHLAAGYVLMSNLYAEAQMQEEAHKTQELRKSAGVWKKPGKAWLEINNVVHEFNVGGKVNPQCNKMHAYIKRLARLIKENGYMAQMDLVLEPA